MYSRCVRCRIWVYQKIPKYIYRFDPIDDVRDGCTRQGRCVQSYKRPKSGSRRMSAYIVIGTVEVNLEIWTIKNNNNETDK